MAKVRRKYGLPFSDGFVSSVKKIMCPMGGISKDSRDWQISPQDGRWIGRLGSQLLGDNRYNQVGLLEDKWGARARQIIALASPSMDDGEPTYGALYTTEAQASRYGTIYARSTDGADFNYQLGKEFGTTHYPATVPAGGINYRMVPIPYNIGTPGGTALTRGINATQRKLFCSGSRKLLQTRNYVLTPGLYASPMKWNKRWNDSTSSGTEVLRAAPWGMIPPLYPPTQSTETAAAGTSDQNWADGDAYYVTVAFIDADGNVSAPFMPRPTSALVTNTKGSAKGGLYVVGTVRSGTAAMTYYQSILHINIAKGPPGTVARALCRTNKINISTTSAEGAKHQTIDEIDLSKLYVITVIQNNTASTYVDANGNDESLRLTLGQIRNDRIWPQPSRYAWEMEGGRICIGYRRLNLGAIILGPTGNAASRDLNDDDSADVVTNKAWVCQRTGTDLKLYSIASPFPGTVGTATTIALSGTLQDLVDTINETLFSGNADEWGAQLVPGVDAFRPATDLIVRQAVAFCTSSGTTLTTGSANGFLDVAVGMLVQDQGTLTTAYVTAKASSTSLTLSANIGSANTTCTFSVDTGESGIEATAPVNGYFRAFNAAFPIVLPLKASIVEAQDGYEDKQEVLFTQGSLGLGGAGPENFTVGNRRKPPPSEDAGILMGGGPILAGCVVCYSKAIFVLENRRDVNSGADEDYKFYILNPNRGCIAWDSIAYGDGWIGYMTRDGYVVTDGQRERLISAAVWNTATREGEWSYEIIQSASAAESDTDGSHFHAQVIGGILWISYRSSGSVTIPDRRIPYDFSAGIESSGLSEILQPDGKPWPWGAPGRTRTSVMGYVDKSTGRLSLGAIEDNAGSTGDGRIDQFDDTATLYDNGESVVVTGCSNTNGQATITGGDFSSVAVGAQIATGQGFADGTSVLSKNSAQTILTMSANGTGFSSQSRTFYGKEIEPIGYCAMDHVDRIREKKSADRFTSLYRHEGTDSTFTVGFSRDKDRATRVTMALTAQTTAEEYGELMVEIPEVARAPGDVVEFDFSHDGRGGVRPEFYGLDAEIMVLDDNNQGGV